MSRFRFVPPHIVDSAVVQVLFVVLAGNKFEAPAWKP